MRYFIGKMSVKEEGLENVETSILMTLDVEKDESALKDAVEELDHELFGGDWDEETEMSTLPDSDIPRTNLSCVEITVAEYDVMYKYLPNYVLC